MNRNRIITGIKSVLRKYHIRKGYLFGSFARGEKRYRDIDIIIHPPEGFSLLKLSGLANDLKEKIGKRVDVLTARSINKRIKKYIVKDMVAI